MAKSIKQYTDLYDAFVDEVESTTGAPVNVVRRAARALLGDGNLQLPDRKTEGFEKTSIEEMFAPDYGVNVKRLGIPVDVGASFRCDVPNLSTLQATVVNDKFIPSADLDSRLPKGVKLMYAVIPEAAPVTGAVKLALDYVRTAMEESTT